MQIVQLIDLLMRNSTYVTNQQNIKIDAKTGLPIANSDVSTVQWYRITARSLPIAYDEKRKDYAYEITYTVSRYQINTPRSPAYGSAKYRGVHKVYNYWFTGENTEVLDFNIDVNANYYVVFSEAGNPGLGAQGRYVVPNSYQSAPTGSLQGGNNNSTLLSAGLASRLYSIADVASTDLKIMGDPDWILQADFYKNSKVNLNAFLEDGSVNSEASEVLFALRFNPQNDYNLDTGLQELWSRNSFIDGTTVKEPQETLIWAAHTVQSKFNGGAFTQQISGTYRTFADAINVPTADSATGVEKDNVATSSSQELQTIIDVAPESAVAAQNSVPTVTRRLQSNGSTTNFNVPSIDSGQPYRDVMIAGQLTRVFGTESDLITYYGNAGQPKQGSLVVSDDRGTDTYG